MNLESNSDYRILEWLTVAFCSPSRSYNRLRTLVTTLVTIMKFTVPDYLKTKKVVQLDDLGAHFNLKIHEVVERIESLQEEGTINGE